MVVHIVIWGLADSKTTIDELRATLPDLERPSTWIWSESSERFGLVTFGEELPEAATWARDLVGEDPSVYEEFDVLE
jgi:hypothetical protein